MDGLRRASAHDIVFQAREGSAELNCCSVNGPRGLGLISDWAVVRDRDQEGLVLNWFGPGKMTVPLRPGLTVGLEQQTEYPRQGRVTLAISPSRPSQFVLKVRVPHWSGATVVRINGKRQPAPAAGYLALERTWRRGDRIDLDLDLGLHLWAGEQECRGRASIYRGPILLTYDRRLNEVDPHRVPALDAADLEGELVETGGWLPVIEAMSFPAAGGKRLVLCDFASAGQGGTPYASWLRVRRAPRTPFSPAHPLRSARP
jgi:DUF1680 family protein